MLTSHELRMLRKLREQRKERGRVPKGYKLKFIKVRGESRDDYTKVFPSQDNTIYV